jgi:hypothetical protein
LDLGGPLGQVDLHPFVTVLRGLDQSTQRRLVTALRSLAAGHDPGVAGLVEHQGLLIELAPGPADQVGDPGRDLVVDTDRVLVEGELVGLRARVDQLERAAAIDAARLEEVRHQLDPEAPARLAEIRRELARHRADEESAPAVALAIGPALQAWRDMAPELVVAEPWVQHLAERWEDHCRRTATCEDRLAGFERRVESASRRLGDAVAALAEAEARAVPIMLSVEEENRLAELATRPVGKGLLRGTRGRSEEEQAEIDALLGRVGQPTYSAYMMYRMAPQPPAEQLQAIDAARDAVDHAERELAEATAARDEDPELAQHRERLEAIRAAASSRLGPLLPDDLGPVLDAHCRRQPNPERELARRRLLEVAADHGLTPPEEVDDESLAAWFERRSTGGEPGTERADRVTDLVARADLYEQRVQRHRRALLALDALEARAARSRGQLQRTAATLSAAGAGAATAADHLLTAIEQRLASPGGSVSRPLVLVGSFAGLARGEVWQLLERLEPHCPDTQVVVLCDHAEAAAWADQAGLHRALVVGAGTDVIPGA